MKTARFSILVFLIAGLTYFLSQVFSGSLILPQSFYLGPLTIHYYGIIMAAAVASGFYFAVKRSSIVGISPEKAEDLLFWVIIGGFIGARLYHVLSSAGYYAHHPIDIIKVWNGGLSIFGAVLGGIVTVGILKKIFNPTSARPSAETGFQFSIFNALDWLVPSVVLGQIIGRFGNLFNYEAFGYPTTLPWRMYVPPQFRPEDFLSYEFFHPWFLYEAIGNVIILWVLLKLARRDQAPAGQARLPSLRSGGSGQVVFLYLLLYNLLRFSLEFLRIDSTFIDGFRLNAIVSLILATVGALGFLYVRNKHVQTP